MNRIAFARTAPVFFRRVREVTDAYFKENGIRPTGDRRLYIKSGILLAALVALYVALVFFTPRQGWVALGGCALMGVVVASVGFNVMHDGAHGSFSTRRWVNELMAHSLNLLGGSAFIWRQKHNENHHTFTNVEGMDDDIDIKPWIRVHAGQKRYWFHRYQHIYSLLLYGTTYLFWIFYNDLRKYFTRRVSDGSPLRPMRRRDHIGFWSTKALHLSLFLLLPMLMVGVLPVLAGYGVMVFVAGVVISVVFQLAHVVEPAGFADPVADGRPIEAEWAVHQLSATANFATRNRVWNWLFGGLNFQIEHHLFPRISHVHYPAISERLRLVCAEFGITYHEFPSLRSALRSHLAHLRKVGAA